MIRPIVRDEFFLAQKAEDAVREDIPIGKDLLDTLKANRTHCVGMAANMIGVRKRAIVVNMGPVDVVMFNPVITGRTGAYETEEGCLSLQGVRKTTRYQKIEVEYLDLKWKPQKRTFQGWTAQIIQHEIDHTNGIII